MIIVDDWSKFLEWMRSRNYTEAQLADPTENKELQEQYNREQMLDVMHDFL